VSPTDRCWRLSRSIGEEGLSFARDLPFDAGRPLVLELTLPGDEEGPMTLEGIALRIAPDDEETEGQAARVRAVSFTRFGEGERKRLHRYIAERMQIP
jgi:hypothetical protein